MMQIISFQILMILFVYLTKLKILLLY